MRRLDQLTAMYADIMGVSQEEARAAIVSTPAGREIARDNPAFLYEQPTANLTDIICEFPPEIRSRFSEDRVEAAVRALPVSATAVKAADVGQKDLLRAARLEARRADLMERSHRGRQLREKEEEKQS